MTTTVYQLDANWRQVAEGPCLVELKGDAAARLHFGDAAPADADTGAVHELNRWRGYSLPYGGSKKAFARAHADRAEVVVTEGTS